MLIKLKKLISDLPIHDILGIRSRQRQTAPCFASTRSPGAHGLEPRSFSMQNRTIARTFLALGALISLTGQAQAVAPQPTTPAPYIVLSDNLDEPDGFGFCFDTYGRGQTDLLHTHSCKPSKGGQMSDDRDNDTRFSMDPETGRISSFAFKGLCMQALIAADVTVLALLECSDHPRQRFSYDAGEQTLRLKENPSLCLAVGPKTLPAGPFVRRPLELVSCDSLDAARKQWTIVIK